MRRAKGAESLTDAGRRASDPRV
ncbi:hypothetical protein FAGKG844_30010 [Frankia sp. AgKG'84/4]